MSSREIVNHLLVNDGTVADLSDAQTNQEEMQPNDLRNYLRSKTVDELFSMFDKTPFGTISVPMVLGDGHVLPADSPENILTDSAKHNNVPIMLGSNRDEPSRFMMLSPANVETNPEGVRSFKDEGRYLRAVKYGAMAWKERGVDTLATYVTKSGNNSVYTYRFDWDEEGTEKGLDLSKAIGAGHSLEIAFVFGNFVDGIGLTYLYEQSDQRDALANSMMSYWSEFAYNGNPGKGRDGTEVEWLSWGTDGKSSIVLDTPSDQGSFMMSDVVNAAFIKKTIAEGPGITAQKERCMHYVRTFRWSSNFDQAEYDNFGPEGCAAFDQSEFAGF
jgi:para-nitrobenzyl esterase